MKTKEILKVLGLFLLIFLLWQFHDFLAREVLFENEGFSFGWGKNFGGLTVLIWFFLFLFWLKNAFYGGLFLMILGGGVNLGDRLIFGKVRDYWYFGGGIFYNNLADYLVVFGLFLFILELWKKNRK
ncbi:signal peptidase II [Patescibacteria group bacterium]|nr:signal peptidase II [Patescibacteria group bacterium]